MASTHTASIYDTITNQIIASLEVGAGKFSLPWHRSNTPLSRPMNAVTRKTYRGVNVLALWASAEAQDFGHGLWATYRQWQSLGAQVRKGEKASPIVFYKVFDKVDGTEAEEREGSAGYPLARTGPVVPAHPGDDQEQGTGAGVLAGALCPALRAPEGAAFSVLTRRHSCLSHCRTPAGALARAQGIRRLRAVARVPLLAGSQGDPSAGTPRVLPSRSQNRNRAPVWRAVPAGPRQGIDSGFPSPSHPRRKAGRMPRDGCGFAGRSWANG